MSWSATGLVRGGGGEGGGKQNGCSAVRILLVCIMCFTPSASMHVSVYPRAFGNPQQVTGPAQCGLTSVCFAVVSGGGGSFGDNVPQVGGGGGKVGCVPRGWITLGRVWSSWLHCLVGVKNGQFAVHVDATALNMFCAAVLQCCGFTCVARLGTKHRPPRKRGSAGPSPVIHSAESSQEPWVGSPPICICSWDMLPFSQRAIRIQIEPGFENSNPRYCQCNC